MIWHSKERPWPVVFHWTLVGTNRNEFFEDGMQLLAITDTPDKCLSPLPGLKTPDAVSSEEIDTVFRIGDLPLTAGEFLGSKGVIDRTEPDHVICQDLHGHEEDQPFGTIGEKELPLLGAD